MIHLFSKHKIRIAVLMLSLCLIATLIPTNAFAYTISELGRTSPVTSLETGSPTDNDYLKLETSRNALNVTFKHSQAFDRIVLRLIKNGKNSGYDKYYSAQVEAGATFSQVYDFSGIPSGEYYFRIVTQSEKQKNAGLIEYTTYLQGVLISVKDGAPSILVYHNLAANNKKMTSTSSTKFYKQTSLEDLRYQLFAKKGSRSSYREVNGTTESKYYKKISDQIVSSSDSDYTKLKKIYTYVANNFYYDHYGVSKGTPGFDDPYNNLKYLNEKKGNNYNAFSGKVAVQCDGYAGIYTALVRAQGIPCRIIYGKKITSGATAWSEVTGSMEKNSHTWVEAWVDGRWITIDPQQGSYSSYTTGKEWLKTALVDYTFFDISSEMLAYTHYSRSIPGGNTSVAYMTSSKEVAQMKAFLNTKSSGKTNGKRLNKSYKSTSKSTWGTKSTFYTDGFGRVQYINWPKKNLSGKLNVSNFTKLKNLTVYVNKLTSLNTKGCSSLQTVAASGNDITSVNLLAAKSLKSADYRTNPITKAQLYANKKNVTVSTVKSGTFGFKYKDKKITIYPKANPGYKYTGIYNANGKRLSTSTKGYTFKPTGKTYKVKFALDPNSFKYYLKQGNKSTLKPYNLAVQKRLKELKYYKKTPTGKYDKTTTTAVKAFQKKNKLKQTGNVDEKTWKKLFSTKAKKK